MLETGKILQNRYRIEKQIGQGGMGAVYVAVDQRFGSIVAIKETLFLGENFEKAFEREAKLLNSLRHPALPNVRDYFAEDTTQYLVMEFIPGEDLSEKLEKNGQAFELEDVLNWTKQLLTALDFLHNQEIPVIHRDIKPQNLKLTPKGQIILLDFGLAKGNPAEAGNLTNAKSIFGYSRNYASLEQMQGTGTDPRSDIYSLAATVYHLATGTPPTDALTRAMRVLSEQPDPLIPANKINRQVPRGIAKILENAMNLNANQRPASALEMLNMLGNSEEYADLENGQMTVAQAVPTNFLDQDTKILPAEIQTGNKNLRVLTAGNEAETKINLSQHQAQDYKTNIAAENFLNTSNTNKRRPFYAVAAVLSLLLIVVGASAFIFMNEDSSSSEAKFLPPPTISEMNTDSALKSLAANSGSVNLSVPDSLNSAANVAKETNTKKPNENVLATTQTKSPESSKPKSEPRIDKTAAPETDDEETVIVDPEQGRVVFKGDRVETDRFIIDEKGIIYKKTPVAPNASSNSPDTLLIPPTPLKIENLTPEQRRRLSEMNTRVRRIKKQQEKRFQIQVRPMPTPQ